MTPDVRYRQALDELYRLAPGGMRLGLESVTLGLERLGVELSALRCVQIAGTNGKGTTSAAVAHGAQACGLRTGLFTSPHLHRFSERFRVNGEEASPEQLEPALRAALDLAQPRGDLPLTFFEVATLAAMVLFAAQRLDLVVLEVGLGGRLDATSAVPKVASAITTIGFDHTEILGNSLAQIAAEKAAIACRGVPLMVGSLPSEALRVVREMATERGAPLRVLWEDFALERDLPASLPGLHMRQNLTVAAELLREFARLDERIEIGLAVASFATLRWPGRWEMLPGPPPVLLDGAHNLEGVEALVATLSQERRRPACLLFGSVMGKPAHAMLERLRTCAQKVVLAPPPLPRAMDCHAVAAPGDVVTPNVAAGLERARALAGPHGLVLVTGSLFTVAEARRLLLCEPSDPPVRL